MIVYPVNRQSQQDSTLQQNHQNTTQHQQSTVAKSYFSGYNPHTSSFLESPGYQQPTASILYTRKEEEEFEVAMEKQARIDRIKQVREQERNLAKEGLVDYAAKKQREAEE